MSIASVVAWKVANSSKGAPAQEICRVATFLASFHFGAHRSQHRPFSAPAMTSRVCSTCSHKSHGSSARAFSLRHPPQWPFLDLGAILFGVPTPGRPRMEFAFRFECTKARSNKWTLDIALSLQNRTPKGMQNKPHVDKATILIDKEHSNFPA